MKNIKIIYCDTLEDVRTEWQKKINNYNKTYFCSLEWHQVVVALYRNTSLTKKINKLTYFKVISNATSATQILGFFYVTSTTKGSVINFSHLLGPSDYYDFIYEDETPSAMITSVVKQIQKDHNATEIRFAHVKNTSKILDMFTDSVEFSKTALDCVAINLPEDYEIYLQSLSKSVKQNLRTAYNRMQKNNVVYNLIIKGQDDYNEIDFNLLKNMYHERNAYRKESLNWKSKVYKKLDYLFRKDLDMFDCNQLKKTNFTLAILEINGELAAYFFGFKRLNKIEINRVVINEVYKFYSPGMLLFNEYIKVGIKDKLEIIDLTVGDEKYKFDLGGSVHQIFNINSTNL